MGAKWFGASVKRKEDPALLTGLGQYVDDIHMSGTLHAAFVRSPHAHARLGKIDATAALALPGVCAVLTFADLPEDVQAQALPLWVPHPTITQNTLPPFLAMDEVCYVGEPVAVIIADSRHIAEDALARVEVDYEPLGAVSDCSDALRPDAPKSHLGASSNVASEVVVDFGSAAAAFASAPHVFKQQIFQHRGGGFSIECRGIVASFDGNTKSLSVFISSQGPHRVKRALMDIFDFADHEIRVVSPDVGGGFGPKQSFYAEYVVVVVCAMRLGAPIKWIEDRRENFLATHQERDQYWDMEIAVDDDARIVGVRGEMIHDSGAYLPWGIVLPWIAASTVPGPYVIPNYYLRYRSVLTNKIPTTPVRGAGRPQAVVVMERLMDRVAREMKLDRAEVRRRNFVRPEQMPYPVGIVFRDGQQVVYDSGDYPKCQEQVLEAADYAGFSARQEAARREGRYIGMGLSSAVEATGLGPFESATVRISSNGKIAVYTGATPQGQSHKTTLAQIAADQFGVCPDDITIITGDTAAVSLGNGSSAARTAVNAGNAVHLASAEVVRKVRRVAADMMEVAEDDIELEGGYAGVRGVPGMRKTFRELAVRSIGMPGFSLEKAPDPGLEHTSYFLPKQSTYANGAHVVEVEVDIETGKVSLLRFTVVHDCGRAINPMVVEGQVVGGIAHGIGNALLERLLYDDNAQPLTTNFGEYAMPSSLNVPRIDVHHNETPSPLNPLGVKGAGEGGTIASIAAILSAVEHALSPFGVTIAEAPISAQRIVELLGEAALGRTR